MKSKLGSGPFKLGRFLFRKDYFDLPFSETSNEKAKVIWIVRLRWLVIAFLAAVVPLGFFSGTLTAHSFWLYVGLLSMLFALNVLTMEGWLEKSGEIRSGHIALQLIFDLVVLTGLLTLTENGLNPFHDLFFINVSLGALLIDGGWSIAFLVLCHLAMLAVQMESGLASHLLSTFVAEHLILLISWGVSRSLSRYISLQKEKLHQVKIYAEKTDRLRALGAMTAGFSHEFASPLNTIKLRINRELRAHPHSPNLQEMNMAVLECESIIHQMNSAQMDPRDIQFQVFGLNSATQKILNSWSHENPEAKIDFRTKIQVDKVRLPFLNYSQSLINLLDNALDANPEGIIQILIDQQQSKVVLSVENAGSSFPEDVLRRFGEPFVTTKSTGTGLGLYSVQLFAQASGGIAFISNSKAGAKVEIHIPQYLEKGGLHEWKKTSAA